MRNIFICVLCFSVLSGSLVFAGSAKKVELQKRVKELTAREEKVAKEFKLLSEQYDAKTAEVLTIRESLRKGKGSANVFDKTGVDKKTVKLIDRCLDARDKYAKLHKELVERLAKSDAGVAREKEFKAAVGSIAGVKESRGEVIKKRAVVGQEHRVVVAELNKAKGELKTFELAEANAAKEKSKKEVE